MEITSIFLDLYLVVPPQESIKLYFLGISAQVWSPSNIRRPNVNVLCITYFTVKLGYGKDSVNNPSQYPAEDLAHNTQQRFA